MNLIIAVSSIITVGCLNPKGPIHEHYAVDCLQELAESQFKYVDSRGVIYNHAVELLTVMTTDNMSSPGFEIQQDLIKKLNILGKFNVEVINNRRNDFGFEIYSRFWLMVVNCVETFERKLEVLLEVKSFDPSAFYLIYYSTLEKGYKSIASVILEKLWENFINNAMVLVPKTLRQFVLITMKFNTKPNHQCMDSDGLSVLAVCTKGGIKTDQLYFKTKIDNNFRNCTIDVIANQINPFVINEKSGLEIDFVKEIGKTLDVFFNITLSGEDSWGQKQNDSWTKGLKKVYESSSLGVGNFRISPEFHDDFDITNPHFRSNFVWIVPTAEFVPKWRVLIAIFSWFMWLLCIGMITLGAAILWITSLLSKKEYKSYKKFDYDFLASFQVFIIIAVFKHPKSDCTRMVFFSLAFFSLIISSVYSSSLIRFLQKPQKGHQVSTIDEVIDAGWKIGGLPEYEEIFHVEEDEKSMKIHQVFQVNDSMKAWLKSVADDRNACTVGSDFFFRYMLSSQDPALTDKNGKTKIFKLPETILGYSLHLVVNKGFPFLDRFDYVIGKMNTYGLVKAVTQKYTYIFDRVREMRIVDSSVEKLSLDHLQGAFGLMVFGYVLSLVIFIVEVLTHCILKKTKTKRKIKPIKK